MINSKIQSNSEAEPDYDTLKAYILNVHKTDLSEDPIPANTGIFWTEEALIEAQKQLVDLVSLAQEHDRDTMLYVSSIANALARRCFKAIIKGIPQEHLDSSGIQLGTHYTNDTIDNFAVFVHRAPYSPFFNQPPEHTQIAQVDENGMMYLTAEPYWYRTANQAATPSLELDLG